MAADVIQALLLTLGKGYGIVCWIYDSTTTIYAAFYWCDLATSSGSGSTSGSGDIMDGSFMSGSGMDDDVSGYSSITVTPTIVTSTAETPISEILTTLIPETTTFMSIDETPISEALTTLIPETTVISIDETLSTFISTAETPIAVIPTPTSMNLSPSPPTTYTEKDEPTHIFNNVFMMIVVAGAVLVTVSTCLASLYCIYCFTK